MALTKAERAKAWRQRHPEKAKAVADRYRERHKEKLRAKMRERMRERRAADPEKSREYQRVWMKNNREKVRQRDRVRLLRRYGLTETEYFTIMEKQGNVCPICEAVPTRIVIDHCHTTGQVRGVLCCRCNRLLGHAKDDPQRLRRAAEYVETHAITRVK